MNKITDTFDICDADIAVLKKNKILYAEGNLSGTQIEIRYRK